MGKFHPAVQNEQTELEYLRSVMTVIMKTSFPNEAYKCDAARELLLEILTENILKSLIDLFSDTFWLHKVIVLILSDDPVEIIDDTRAVTGNVNVPKESVIQSTVNTVPIECVSEENTGVENNTVAQSELCSDILNAKSSNKSEGDQPIDTKEERSIKAVQYATNALDAAEDAAPYQSISVDEFRPTFFVGDFDTFSNHSAESDTPDTLQRVAPEGCSPPKDYTSASNVPLPQPHLVTFQNVTGEETDSLKNMTPEGTSSDDELGSERKEIYRLRNKKWNPQEDRIIPSPLTLLTDASTYQETVDISNAESLVPTAHSAPNCQTLKIDYGPDISNIDPAALIKENTKDSVCRCSHSRNRNSKRTRNCGTLYSLLH